MVDERITKSARGCLDIFTQLSSLHVLNALQQPTHAAIEEEETRFKVWSGNIGAHKSGRASLQYRLRDASHLQEHIVELLKDLSELLTDYLAICNGEVVPWDQQDDEGSCRDDGAWGPEDGPIDTGPTTELEQIADSVRDVIKCLLRLSVAIRNPAPHDSFAASGLADVSHYEPFDIQHIRGKFDAIDDALAERLGRAMSRRRQYFKYRESHHAKLSQGLVKESSLKDTKSTVASSIPRQAKDTDFDPRLSALDEDNISETGMSQTSFASSTGNADRIGIPPLPKEAESGPFECPFCYTMIVATNRVSWRRHVLADLQPYICLAQDCEVASEPFAKRHQWALHDLENHWKVYSCPFSCGQSFSSKTDCQGHLRKSHPNDISSNQLDAMINLASRLSKEGENKTCPMCRITLSSAKEYHRHVGRHQEELALFTLPSIVALENSLDDNSDASSDDDTSSEAIDLASAQVEEAGQRKITDNVETTLGTLSISAIDLEHPTQRLRILETAKDSLWTPSESSTNQNTDHINKVTGTVAIDPTGAQSEPVDAETSSSGDPGNGSKKFSVSSLGEILDSKDAPNKEPTSTKLINDDLINYWYMKPGELARYDLDHQPKVPQDTRHPPMTQAHRNYNDGFQGLRNQLNFFDDLLSFERSVHDISAIEQSITREQSSRGEVTLGDEPERSGLRREKGGNETDSQDDKTIGNSDSEPIREIMAPRIKDIEAIQVPPESKWTRISRKVVSPEALTIGKERFEVRDDWVIVLRILSKEEVQAYVMATKVLRERRGVEGGTEGNEDMPGIQHSKDDENTRPQEILTWKKSFGGQPMKRGSSQQPDPSQPAVAMLKDESSKKSESPREERTCSHSSFELIKSKDGLVQWWCQLCRSGPHAWIYQCRACPHQVCRSCSMS